MKESCFLRRFILMFGGFIWLFTMQAQIPNGYYDSARGTKGKELKTALFHIVSEHAERTYKQLWEDFKVTDVRSDGKIWDMYSNVTSYVPGGPQQGVNYKVEGDSYNREHSFPKSWFNDEYPMYTDLFHLYPTDGYVNGRRSNYPFGENNGEIYKSANVFSKLGASTVAGYTGTVFEPADEYKGDFARTYFYMVTAYEDKIASWNSPMLSGDSYTAYANWALTMLLRWAQEDPVSEKEINRNNAVYGIQNNRNPFIDFPGLEQYVWGSATSSAFDPDNYIFPDDPQPAVPAPSFSPASGVVDPGTVVTIYCASEGADIVYTINGGEEKTEASPVELVISQTTNVSAYSVLHGRVSETVTATYRISGGSAVSQGDFTLLTDNAQLVDGQEVLIVCRPKLTAMSAQGKDIRQYVELESVETAISSVVNQADYPYAFLLQKVGSYWTILDQVENVYLSLTSNNNKLHVATSPVEDGARWNIDISSDGMASITNVQYPNRLIQYNAGAPRFACYTGTQMDVSLYARSSDTAVDCVTTDVRCGTEVIAYRINGTLAAKGKNMLDVINSLPLGTYIINGKVILR